MITLCDIYLEKENAEGGYDLTTVRNSVSAEYALMFLGQRDDTAYQYIVAELSSWMALDGERDVVSRTRGDEWLEEHAPADSPGGPPSSSTTLSVLDDGTHLVTIQAGLTSAHGFGSSARIAYQKADRDLRCKQKWGALHSLMDSAAPGGCWDDWKRQIAEMQHAIDELTGEVASLLCPF